MISSKRLIVILFLAMSLSSCSIFKLSDEYEDWEIKNIFEESYKNKDLSFSQYPSAKVDSLLIDINSKKVNRQGIIKTV